MKISTILDHIDSGHMALPEFQRGFVWNSDQVRKLFVSLYLRRPVGSLLVWAAESRTAAHRGEGPLTADVVKLLLDGQQRMTSLYGVVRGKPPKFFDGNAKAFTGLRFHLDMQTFEFYQPVKMRDDPLWIDVTELMKKGTAGLGEFVTRLAALEGPEGGLGKLLDQLRLWHGGLRVEPGNFTGWSLGARFYPVLYLLTRMGQSRDWGTGLPLKASLLGKMSRLEVHHIFPKAQLYKHKFKRPEVNALGNFCFLTKDTNLDIRDRLPEEYFPKVEEAHPGALASQWIPDDPALWKIENFRAFLEARKSLLASEVNQRMEELLHGDVHWMAGPTAVLPAAVAVYGGITSEEEEEQLEALNDWMEKQGLSRGVLAYDFADVTTGEQKSVFDLAWPNGIQENLSQPVVVLVNESTETIAIASQAGYRCFTTIAEFQRYVNAEVLGQEAQ